MTINNSVIWRKNVTEMSVKRLLLPSPGDQRLQVAQQRKPQVLRFVQPTSRETLLNLWGAVSHCVTRRRRLWTGSSISYLLSSPSSANNGFNNQNEKNLTCLGRTTTWGPRQTAVPTAVFSNSLAGLMESHSCNWPGTDVAIPPQGQEGRGWRSYPNSQLFFSGYSLYLFL